jgi:hypothetical protein
VCQIPSTRRPRTGNEFKGSYCIAVSIFRIFISWPWTLYETSANSILCCNAFMSIRSFNTKRRKMFLCLAWIYNNIWSNIYFSQELANSWGGTHSGYGTILQTGKSRVRYPMRCFFFNYLILSVALGLGFTQHLSEMSARNIKTIMFLGSKVQQVRRADNLTTICEPIV